MNETFYQLYKSGRDMVEKSINKDVSEPFQNFINSIESGIKSFDKANSEYSKRWEKERNSD